MIRQEEKIDLLVQCKTYSKNFKNNKSEENSNIIKNIIIEYGKPIGEYKDFLNIWNELTKENKKN